MSNSTSTGSLTSHVVGQWGTFSELRGSILPRIFGHMVTLASPVVKEYHSDLYHDARWLDENVDGPMIVDYLVRTSGTNLGVSAQSMRSIGAPGGVYYTLTLHSADNRVWTLDILEHPPLDGASPSTLPDSHKTVLTKCEAEVWRNLQCGDSNTEADAAADIVQHLTVEYDLP